MDSLKLAFLKFLNKSSKFDYSATEVPTVKGFLADILASNQRYSYEFELKRQLVDVVKGEPKKVKKHVLYANPDKEKTRIPNYFSNLQRRHFFVSRISLFTR